MDDAEFPEEDGVAMLRVLGVLGVREAMVAINMGKALPMLAQPLMSG
jgi:hypothetical protein